MHLVHIAYALVAILHAAILLRVPRWFLIYTIMYRSHTCYLEELELNRKRFEKNSKTRILLT